MLGHLKPDATCPECGDPLSALVNTENSAGVEHKYFHGKRHEKVRRRIPCVAKFESHAVANIVRRSLEVGEDDKR